MISIQLILFFCAASATGLWYITTFLLCKAMWQADADYCRKLGFPAPSWKNWDGIRRAHRRFFSSVAIAMEQDSFHNPNIRRLYFWYKFYRYGALGLIIIWIIWQLVSLNRIS
jgi:hypothetical protein